jgi:hypothetical protein
LRAGIRQVNEIFGPLVEAAKEKAKNSHDRSELEELKRQWSFELSEFSDALSEIDSQELIKRANSHDLDVPPIPADAFNGEEGDWIIGNFGNTYLSRDAYRKVSATVKQREREHAKYGRERWQFWIGILATIVGLTLSTYNVFVSSKSVSDLRKEIDSIRVLRR